MNLNQITIYSKDVKKAVRFYQKLGLLLIVDSIPRYARLLCPDGDSTLSLHETDQTSSFQNIVLYFECVELDKTVSELKEKGIGFEQEPTDQTWLWREACLRDPEGNKIILFYGGENRQNPPWRVK
jgi:catechol 2,3-dioxygenase-like lactoylglutathione lyase family enzyme